MEPHSRRRGEGRAPGQPLREEARRVLSALDGGTGAEILAGAGGRPYYGDFHADFSISHSGRAAAVLWSNERRAGGGLLLTGCDIQRVKPGWDFYALGKRFFSGGELSWIGAGENREEQSDRFFKIWTLKESWIKLRGLSVFNIKKAPAFFPGEGFFLSGNADDRALVFFLWELDDPAGRCFLAAVRETAAVQSGPPSIRWFSRETPRRFFPRLECRI